jgi:hypothetical protein
MEFGVSVVLFFLLGSWADDKWGAAPWMTVAGGITGVVVGTYLLIKQALASQSAESTPDRSDGPKRTP